MLILHNERKENKSRLELTELFLPNSIMKGMFCRRIESRSKAPKIAHGTLKFRLNTAGIEECPEGAGKWVAYKKSPEFNFKS